MLDGLVGTLAFSDNPPPGADSARTVAARLQAPIAFCHFSINPTWSDDGNTFWYRNRRPDQPDAYVVVDAVRGTRTVIDRLDPQFQRLRSATPQARVIRSPKTAIGGNGAETSILFRNDLAEPVSVYWIASNQRTKYFDLEPGQSIQQHTYAGHVWEAVTRSGKTAAFFQAIQPESMAKIQFDLPVWKADRSKPPSRRDRPSRRQTMGSVSPGGTHAYRVNDGNVFLLSPEASASPHPSGTTRVEGQVQVTFDGTAERPYRLIQWSPDSRFLVAFQKTPGQPSQVHLVESSPRGGGPARLHSRPYPLPGDVFDAYELTLISVDDRHATKIDVEPIDFGVPQIRWNQQGNQFTYQKIDRGRQRLRLIQVDTASKKAHAVIDEQSDTFVWTAHGEAAGIKLMTFLQHSDELIYASEQSGYRHLYLVDLPTGKQTLITSGDWVVRGIDRIDEDNRQIWFRASGLYSDPASANLDQVDSEKADQDPYFIHYCRISFDGTDLVRLTEGNGTHAIQYSPDRRFLIDTYSRVDQPPIHELRRTSDGSLVCQFERGDADQFVRTGVRLPEPFTAKGRDGRTDIWGNIYRPADFNPNRYYPIIEDIYAGPHDAYVQKQFRLRTPYRELTDNGFIVVKIDGMGTAHRGKSFHDVCWQNLKDAGFPDRIAWIKAAAKKYPYMDTERVGIYGTSAGGQNAAGAVLFHPGFYKAAVASCGCHDNRMDKASWNEQWMGFPVGPHYGANSNIDNAHRLGGKLMLIVGEMDRNVPPESTLRLADALIKADKDFELLVIPGMGHSDGGSYGRRRRLAFFKEHLLGGNSKENATKPASPLRDAS